MIYHVTCYIEFMERSTAGENMFDWSTDFMLFRMKYVTDLISREMRCVRKICSKHIHTNIVVSTVIVLATTIN